MEPKPVDLTLLSVLNQLIAELPDPAYQYMVSANFYDHQSPERFGERWHIAQIWLSAESADHVTLNEEGLLCDVRLNRDELSQVSCILLPYDQIWSIQRLTQSVFIRLCFTIARIS